MVQALTRALLAAGITACVVTAAAVGYLRLASSQKRQAQQPALLEEQSVSDPPPLVVVINRSQLE